MNYFNFQQAEADMQAALAAGDGIRYTQIHAAVAQARGELPAPLYPAPRQEAWPLAPGTGSAALAACPPCTGWQRFGAWLIDWVAYMVLWVICAAITAVIPFIGVFFLLGLLGAAIANQWVMGTTGQSLGKKAVGIYLVSETTRQPVGGWTGIGRYFLHLLDSFALCIGWIVGLATGQTFADRIVHTVVVAKPRP